MISDILQSDAAYRLGWVLLHSLWQLAALGCVLAEVFVMIVAVAAGGFLAWADEAGLGTVDPPDGDKAARTQLTRLYKSRSV
jgi:hypothetical protein